MTTKDDLLMTTGAFARKVDRSREVIRDAVAQGRISAVPTPLGHLIPASELQRYLSERQTREAARGTPKAAKAA